MNLVEKSVDSSLRKKVGITIRVGFLVKIKEAIRRRKLVSFFKKKFFSS